MIFLKIVAIVFGAVASFVQINLEHRWHDQRTKKHRIYKGILYVLMVLGFLSASILIYYDDRQVQEQLQTLKELKSNAQESQKNAEKREAVANRNQEQIEKQLDSLENQMKPILNLAARKYPTLDTNSALLNITADIQNLQRQNEELKEKTTDLEQRDVFCPPSARIKALVEERLKQILSTFSDRNITIAVECQSGNTNRHKVSRQLVDTLSISSFRTAGPLANMTFSNSVLPDVKILMNPADKDIASQLANALNPYLKVQFTGKVDDKLATGNLKISIFGNPFFSKEGVVTFQ